MRWCLLTVLTGLIAACPTPVRGATGRVTITVADAESGSRVPCRIHLKNAKGEPQHAGDLPFFKDHFTCPGTVELNLEPGVYSYEVERGPEIERREGRFTVADGSDETVSLTLKRIADMAAEGWWSADLHVHRPVGDIELLMRAEDLHVAPVMTWWNNRNLWSTTAPPADTLVRFDGNRLYDVMAGEDEREGGALLYFHLKKPLAIAGSKREFPSPMVFVAEARKQPGVWIDAEKPFWWDFPVWLALGAVDSIGLANNHMNRSTVDPNEAWGRPRDRERLPDPWGNGLYSQEIYYHVLNCGLRIPPSAGSASGVLPNPVGYDRVYVDAGKNLTDKGWWQGLRAGRAFVTNGPLFRFDPKGERPGHLYLVPGGRELTASLSMSLVSRDPIRSVEVIKDGRVERTLTAAEVAQGRTLGSLSFRQSGWFLVRAIADVPYTFRFASTAPYYVEIGPQKRRISRASVQFFLDWVRERAARVKLDDPDERRKVLKYHEDAERFWQELLAKANAD
jgi:hypothetical protein